MDLHNPSPSLATPVSVANGGTGQTTAAAALTALGVPRVCTSGFDQAFTSTTDFADVSGQSVTLETGSYWLELQLVAFDTDSGFKWQLTGAATASANQKALRLGVSGADFISDIIAGDNMTAWAGNRVVQYSGLVIVTGAGTLKLQGAQNSSSSNSLFLHHASMVFTKVPALP